VGKVCSMAEAIARWVPDGAAAAMGCALEAAIPFAAGHEIIRQGRRDLTVIGPISDMLFDLLTGAGCVRKVTAAWVGNVGDGLGHNFRRAVEQRIPRAIEVEDHTNLTLALGLQAAAWGVSYLPTLTALGSDLLAANPNLKPATCPFTGDSMVAVRAIRPDVTIVHVQRADPDGNAHLWGNLGVVVEAARAARHVIVSCEELVPTEEIRAHPERTTIPFLYVDAVVVQPYGAYPTSTYGHYDYDAAHVAAYQEAARQGSPAVDEYLRRYVWGCATFDEYLALAAGSDRLIALRRAMEEML